MIASDKEGESLAFGSTVPFITTDTPQSEIVANSAYLIERLSHAHRRRVDAMSSEESRVYTVSIPVPVKPTERATFNETHLTAMKAVSAVLMALDHEGFTILSVTPIAASMGDLVMPGYLVYTGLPEAAEAVMDEQGSHREAGTWIDRATQIYGTAAVEEYSERMQASMEQMMSELAGQEPH